MAIFLKGTLVGQIVAKIDSYYSLKMSTLRKYYIVDMVY